MAGVINTEQNGNRIELNDKYDVGLILVPEEDRPLKPKPIATVEINSVYVIKYCFYIIFLVLSHNIH